MRRNDEEAGLKTSTFQMRINPADKKELDEICSRNGYSLTDAVNMLFAQMKLAQGLPFILSPENAAFMRKKAEDRFAAEAKKGFDSGERDGWITEEEICERFGVEL